MSVEEALRWFHVLKWILVDSGHMSARAS